MLRPPGNYPTRERNLTANENAVQAVASQLPALLAQAQQRSAGFPPIPPLEDDYDENGNPIRYLRFGDPIDAYPIAPLKSTD